MAVASLSQAADKIRADTAGVKGEADKVKNVAAGDLDTGVTSPITTAFRKLGTSVEHSLHLTGGPHPESIPTDISTAITKATDAVRGPNGGTVAPSTSVTAPGPAGPTNASAGGLGAAVASTRQSIGSRIKKALK